MSLDSTRIDILSVHRAANAARAKAMAELFATVGRWLKRITFDRLTESFRRRAQLEQLMAMDERQLRDLGLTRGNIAHAMTFGREDVPAPANVNARAKDAPRAA